MLAGLKFHLFGRDRYRPGLLAEGLCSHDYYYKSFAVTPEQIQQMIAFMTDAMHSAFPGEAQSLAISADSVHGEQLPIGTVHELLGYLNQWSARIGRLIIEVSVSERKMGALVEFGDCPSGWTVAVNVEGQNHKAVETLSRNLNSTILNTFHWHSFLSPNRFWNWLSLILMAMVLLVFAPVLIHVLCCSSAPFGNIVTTNTHTGQVIDERPVTASEYVNSRLWSDGLFFTALIVIAVVARILRFVLFPKASFLIGLGRKREEVAVKVRWVLLGSVVIPLLLQAGLAVF